MRDIPPGLAAALQAQATTLCRCWRLTRRDGAIMGFTDHDEDLAFAGATFRAQTGLDAAEAETAAGLAVGAGDVHGALVDGGVGESDIAAGLYDGASIEIWLVDWSHLENRVLIDAATIGEIRCSEFAFVAELRSLAHRFDEERGRQFQRNCAADLGDAACRIDLADPLWSTGATVLATERDGDLLVEADANFAPGFFTDGTLAIAGRTCAIKLHERAAAGDRVLLWGSPSLEIAAGVRVNQRAGCDKSPETCRGKFDNIVNFRGFPHMPGNDAVVAYPNAAGAPMDGGSLFR